MSRLDSLNEIGIHFDPDQVTAEAGGRLVLVIPFENEEHAQRHIFGLGAIVEVLEPQSLREYMVQSAARILEMHEG